jgi:hypothetical protein
MPNSILIAALALIAVGVWALVMRWRGDRLTTLELTGLTVTVLGLLAVTLLM